MNKARRFKKEKSMEESSPQDLDDDEFFDDEDESFASIMHKREKVWELRLPRLRI